MGVQARCVLDGPGLQTVSALIETPADRLEVSSVCGRVFNLWLEVWRQSTRES